MRQFSKVGNNDGRVCPQFILRLKFGQRFGQLAAHKHLKQVKHPPAISQPQQAAHGFRIERIARIARMGQRAVEQ